MHRLVYLCDWLPPDFGAVGQCSLAFARRYARDDGLEVVLVGLSSGGVFRSSEALGRGHLTVIKVPAKPFDRSRWRKRLWWTLCTDLRLIRAAWKELRRCDTILFTGAPPFLLHLLVPLKLLLRKRLVYRITDFYPECLIAAIGRAPWALRLLYRWTCLLRRRWVDQFQVLGRDQERRLGEIGVPSSRIVIKRDPSPVAITGSERPLRAPSEIAGFVVLLYSGNFGVAHEVETFLEGYRAHHRQGGGRVALWLNAIGSNADRLERGCRSLMLPVARTRPLPFHLLPRLLVTPAAHLITLRSQFTGFVLPSKVYGCIASGRAILYVGDRASDVHGLCDRDPGIPLYRQADIGDPDGVAAALADIADLAALTQSLERVRVNSGAYTNGHDHRAPAAVASAGGYAEPRRELETQGVRAGY